MVHEEAEGTGPTTSAYGSKKVTGGNLKQTVFNKNGRPSNADLLKQTTGTVGEAVKNMVDVMKPLAAAGSSSQGSGDVQTLLNHMPVEAKKERDFEFELVKMVFGHGGQAQAASPASGQ